MGECVKEEGVTTTESARTKASSRPLTEQQKNGKGRKTSFKQQETLEMEFTKNRTPTTIIQERIAKDINMTQRSVYIWFQNRRAKEKLRLKKNIENGENYDVIPEACPRILFPDQLTTPSGEILVRPHANERFQPQSIFSVLQPNNVYTGTEYKVSVEDDMFCRYVEAEMHTTSPTTNADSSVSTSTSPGVVTVPAVLKKFPCTFPGCNKGYSRSEHLQRHARNHEGGGSTCERCSAHFKRPDLLSMLFSSVEF
ncbi:hypothetical protein F5884DRAFT_809075 [Xylogone sp. PMI_703]|nr:hypothetical protein F5884DRAFT_809075 [Xylogone sp. PMI_703]